MTKILLSILLFVLGISCGRYNNGGYSESPCKAHIEGLITNSNTRTGYEYYYIGGNCFVHATDNKDKVTYTTAKQRCENMWGKLITVSDAGMSWLVKFLVEADGNQAIWNGITNGNADGVWTREDNEEILEFFYWANGNKQDRETKKCAEIQAVTGKWKPVDCRLGANSGTDSTRNFVCKVIYDATVLSRNGPIGYTTMKTSTSAPTGPHQLPESVFDHNLDDYRCRSVSDAGVSPMSLQAIMVPEGWAVKLSQRADCQELPWGPNHGNYAMMFTGPITVNIPNQSPFEMRGQTGGVTGYIAKKVDLGDYPIFYRDENFNEIGFIAAFSCGITTWCHKFLGANQIKAIIVPAGWQVTIYNTHFHTITAEIGAKYTIYGPDKVILEHKASTLKDNVHSYKIERNQKAKLEVLKYHFDKRVDFGIPQPTTLDIIEVINPSSVQRTVKRTVEVSTSETNNWFSEESSHNSHSMSVEVSQTIAFKVKVVEAETSISTSYGYETGKSWTENRGGETSRSETQTLEVECTARPQTKTTCSVLQLTGEMEIPYDARITYTFADGKEEHEDVKMALHVRMGTKGYIDVQEEDLFCNEEGAVLFGDYCYTVHKFSSTSQSREDAQRKCFEDSRGASLPDIRSLEEMYIVRQLCIEAPRKGYVYLGGRSSDGGTKVKWDGDENAVFPEGVSGLAGDPWVDGDGLFVGLQHGSGAWATAGSNGQVDCVVCKAKVPKVYLKND